MKNYKITTLGKVTLLLSVIALFTLVASSYTLVMGIGALVSGVEDTPRITNDGGIPVISSATPFGGYLMDTSQSPDLRDSEGNLISTSPDISPDTGSGTSPDTGSGTSPDTGSGTSPGTSPDTGSGTSPDTGSGTSPDTGSGTSPDMQTDFSDPVRPAAASAPTPETNSKVEAAAIGDSSNSGGMRGSLEKNIGQAGTDNEDARDSLRKNDPRDTVRGEFAAKQTGLSKNERQRVSALLSRLDWYDGINVSIKVGESVYSTERLQEVIELAMDEGVPLSSIRASVSGGLSEEEMLVYISGKDSK